MKKFFFFAFIVLSVLILFGACGGGGDDLSSNSPSGDTNIATPNNFKAIPGDKQIILSWDKVTGAKSYTLYGSRISGKGTAADQSFNITDTNYTHDGLINGTTYYYTLSATSFGGKNSPLTNEISGAPAPCVLHTGTLTGDGGYKLPDTGQTKSFTDTCGEDSDYVINAKSYTDNGNKTITDNNTGLMWEKLPNTGDHKNMTLAKAIEECKKGTTGNHRDWRLPTVRELLHIADLNKYKPAIDTTYFPNTKSSYYWSSSLAKNETMTRVTVHFGGGGIITKYNHDTSNYPHVRCVRSPKPQPKTKFTDNGNKTVTDSKTGLMWQKLPEEKDHVTKTWENAIKRCEALSFAGFADWRLPNWSELLSILDLTRYEPMIDTTYFPNTKSDWYWSSSSGASDASNDSKHVVDFDNGSAYSFSKSSTYYVRCVRSR